MSEAGSGTTSATASTHSTPTPPNVRRGRRLRKCATPIKSAKKVEQHEKVTIQQSIRLASLTGSANSSNSEATPSSSGTNTPAKIENDSKVS